MDKPYNELTKRLLKEGYTAEKHPDWVVVGRACQEKDDPLRNLDGGFEYVRWWIYEKAFRTPCGIMCKGLSCMTNLSYMGHEWSYENDAATIHCPYYNTNCEKKDSRLPREGVLKDLCNVHMVDEPYQYKGSLEDMLKLKEGEIRRKKLSFILQKHGRACENHMYYDKEKEEWRMEYNPAICANLRCKGVIEEVGHRGICPIFGRELDQKMGNVYYDIKESGIDYTKDGTFFEGERFTNIIKGKRAFESKVSMDICRAYVKLCKDKLKHKEKLRYHHVLFFAKYYGRDFHIEVCNIRAEQKESRDLMQDLEDIRAGATITHESDRQKSQKREKSECRKAAQKKKVEKLEKKLLEVGYDNLPENSIDRAHADKWLEPERIEELEEKRKKQIQNENSEEQLSLFKGMEEL